MYRCTKIAKLAYVNCVGFYNFVRHTISEHTDLELFREYIIKFSYSLLLLIFSFEEAY